MHHQNFPEISQHCVNTLFNHIESTYPDFDVDLGQDSLSIAISDKTIFLITINNSAQQIWLSSPVSGGHHFFHSPQHNAWISTRQDTCQLLALLNQELSDIAHTLS